VIFLTEKKKRKWKNEKVDKLILNSLCCEIMDEVMNLGNAYPKDCKITPKPKPSSSGEKVRETRINQNKIVQDERIFLE
jgi:hypothetical protein